MKRRGFLKALGAALIGATAARHIPLPVPLAEEAVKVGTCITECVEPISFSGMKWIEDPYCPPDIIYFIAPRAKLYVDEFGRALGAEGIYALKL